MSRELQAIPTRVSTRRPILWETAAVAAVCTLDALSTVILVERGMATEANPFLAWTFRHSAGMFLLVKFLSFLPALVILEALRTRRERFVRLALRTALAAYVGIYLFGTLALQLNR